MLQFQSTQYQLPPRTKPTLSPSTSYYQWVYAITSHVPTLPFSEATPITHFQLRQVRVSPSRHHAQPGTHDQLQTSNKTDFTIALALTLICLNDSHWRRLCWRRHTLYADVTSANNIIFFANFLTNWKQFGFQLQTYHPLWLLIILLRVTPRSSDNVYDDAHNLVSVKSLLYFDTPPDDENTRA